MLKKSLFAFFLLLGVAGFCAVPFIVGVDRTLEAIGDVGWMCVASYLGTAVMVFVIPGIAWWILMRSEGIPATLAQAIKANVMGAPLNFFTPSAYLGGEPLKTFYIAKMAGVTKRRVLATIIASKVQEIAALLLLMFASAVYFVWRAAGALNRRDEILLIVSMVLLVSLFALVMIGFYRDARPTVKLINLLAGMGVAKRKLARLRSKAEDMERIIHACLVHRWKAALLSQFVLFFSALSILVRPYVYFAFTRQSAMIPLEDVCMTYVIVNFVNTLTIIPGSLGLLEGGVTKFWHLRGLGDHNGAAFMIINRIADAVFVSLGLWLIMHYGLAAVAKGVAKGTEKIEEKDLHDAAEAEEKLGGITRPPGRLNG
ncbi:MAG: flippase-like domain-containing protein [Planctomycetes bacterium]|nr:flippase-like domain-containing protein [Planctomycetota bacterium]